MAASCSGSASTPPTPATPTAGEPSWTSSTRSEVLPGAGVAIEAVLDGPSMASSAVVFVHGYGGSAHDLIEPAAALAGHGHLVAAISMRGFGASGGVDDCGWDQPDDVTAVVAHLRSTHEKLTRVGLLGISQGGQVVLLAASRGAAVQAVAAWAPVTDVSRWRETTAYPGIPAYIDDRCADGRLARRSPLSVAGDLEVPVLLVHGDADTRVPTEQSRLLHDAIRAGGGQSDLVLLPGVEHLRGPDGNRQAMEATTAFFTKHLRSTGS